MCAVRSCGERTRHTVPVFTNLDGSLALRCSPSPDFPEAPVRVSVDVKRARALNATGIHQVLDPIDSHRRHDTTRWLPFQANEARSLRGRPPQGPVVILMLIVARGCFKQYLLPVHPLFSFRRSANVVIVRSERDYSPEWLPLTACGSAPGVSCISADLMASGRPWATGDRGGTVESRSLVGRLLMLSYRCVDWHGLAHDSCS